MLSAVQYAPRPVAAAETSTLRLQLLIGLLTVFAVTYTAMVAMLTARGVPLGFGAVSLIEIALLGSGILVALVPGVRQADWPAIGFAYAMIVIALFVSILNDRPMIETVRTTLIIGVFCLLGQRAEESTLHRVFLLITAISTAVLVLEVAYVKGFVWIFQPQAFYGATRGFETAEFNDTGLFNTTSGFIGRFSFGLFDKFRTSSIFMEQVSHANFACVLGLYLSFFWGRLKAPVRWFYVFAIVFILVTTNARFASLLVIALLAGHFVFPRLPRWMIPLVGVGALTMIALITIAIGQGGDTFVGRFTHAGVSLGYSGLSYFFGGDAWQALGQADSGYAYVIGTTTIFGLAVLWIFLSFFPRADDAGSKRLAFGLAVYFFGQLVVSGTSLFSIKTAALLWLMIGFVRVNRILPERPAKIAP